MKSMSQLLHSYSNKTCSVLLCLDDHLQIVMQFISIIKLITEVEYKQ